MIFDPSGCLSKDKAWISREIIFEEDRVESRRLSESNDLGSLTRSDFECHPAAGLEVASDCGNETSENFQTIMSSEEGSSWVMGDFLRQGLFFAFRYVREVSYDEMVRSDDSLQKKMLIDMLSRSTALKPIFCQSQGGR